MVVVVVSDVVVSDVVVSDVVVSDFVISDVVISDVACGSCDGYWASHPILRYFFFLLTSCTVVDSEPTVSGTSRRLCSSLPLIHSVHLPNCLLDWTWTWHFSSLFLDVREYRGVVIRLQTP